MIHDPHRPGLCSRGIGDCELEQDCQLTCLAAVPGLPSGIPRPGIAAPLRLRFTTHYADGSYALPRIVVIVVLVIVIEACRFENGDEDENDLHSGLSEALPRTYPLTISSRYTP